MSFLIQQRPSETSSLLSHRIWGLGFWFFSFVWVSFLVLLWGWRGWGWQGEGFFFFFISSLHFIFLKSVQWGFQERHILTEE